MDMLSALIDPGRNDMCRQCDGSGLPGGRIVRGSIGSARKRDARKGWLIIARADICAGII